MKQIFIALTLFILIGAASAGGAAQNGRDHDRKVQRAVQKLTKEIKATENGKYLVRFETSDQTTALYFKPAGVLWRKLSDAERTEIAADWWRRWQKIIRPIDETLTDLQSLDGKTDVYCTTENGVDPICTN